MKLWRPFVAPVVAGQFGTRDFSRLLVHQRRLFQEEGVLLDSLLSNTEDGAETAVKVTDKTHELPYYAKWLLIAASLASFNPSRMDALYFMKSTEKKRKKKGGGTARSGGGRASQHRKVPRHLLAPSAFTLDRLLAILHAILPHDLRSTIDVYTQIATLAGLRLMARSGGLGSSDPLEPGGKWRVGAAVSWDYMQALSRSLKFEIADYLAD
jgi:origin recognition complex subunit 5